MPVTARHALLILPLSLQAASFIMESGTVRIRPFPGLQKTLLRRFFNASFFPHAPFAFLRRTARPQVHRLLHTSFIPRGRVKEMSWVHKTVRARFRNVREAVQELAGCGLFRERLRSTTDLSFVSGVGSFRVVHAAVSCFWSVQEAPRIFP